MKLCLFNRAYARGFGASQWYYYNPRVMALIGAGGHGSRNRNRNGKENRARAGIDRQNKMKSTKCHSAYAMMAGLTTFCYMRLNDSYLTSLRLIPISTFFPSSSSNFQLRTPTCTPVLTLSSLREKHICCRLLEPTSPITAEYSLPRVLTPVIHLFFPFRASRPQVSGLASTTLFHTSLATSEYSIAVENIRRWC